MTKRNYTLIELLTVIFIIAVLAGLIIPATGMVRGRAKRLNCASNLKQVGSLCMQFSNDREGQIPMYKTASANAYAVRSKNIENYHRKAGQSRFEAAKGGTSVISTGDRVYWTVGLLRYAKYDMSVFFCPSDERDVNVFDFSGNSSYSLNYGDANRPGGVAEGTAYVKMTQVTRSPAGVILLGETDNGKLGMDSTPAASSFFNTNFKSPLKRKPHSNEYNTSFLDGHVDSLRTSDLQDLFNKKYYQITQ